MTIWDFEDKHEKEVVLTTKDDIVFRGILYLGETEFDSTSGEDEIDIDTGKAYVGIPVSDVKEVVIV